MTHRATASFDVTGWDETPYHESADKPRLARATVTKTFRGDLEGESTAELLMCQADPENFSAGAGYVASERITCQIGERSGSFVLQHGGLSSEEDGERSFGHVVPGSGTGDLVGIRGDAEIGQSSDGEHVLTLDYEFKKDKGGAIETA